MKEPEQITIGCLGTFLFPAGYYLYVGSAMRGLQARLLRHRRREKKRHWHIDYLLPRAELLEEWYVTSEERLECCWAQLADQLPGARIIVPHFGASDCRCAAHLVYLPYRPGQEFLPLERAAGSASASTVTEGAEPAVSRGLTFQPDCDILGLQPNTIKDCEQDE